MHLYSLRSIALRSAIVVSASLGFLASPAGAQQKGSFVPCTNDTTVRCWTSVPGVSVSGTQLIFTGPRAGTKLVIRGLTVGADQKTVAGTPQPANTCAGKNFDQCGDCVELNLAIGAYRNCKPFPETCYTSAIQRCMNLYSDSGPQNRLEGVALALDAAGLTPRSTASAMFDARAAIALR